MILGVIPARYGSSRFPGKPLARVNGTPLIQLVWERAKAAKRLERLLVATDDPRIGEAVRRFGGEAVMTAKELPSGTDRVWQAAQGTPARIVVNIQGDEPLIAPHMIDEAIRPLLDDATIPVGTLVKAITSSDELLNPNVVKVVLDDQGCGVYFSRSPIPYLRDPVTMDKWHLHHHYYKHIGLYVYRRSFLLEFATWPESVLERAEKLEQLRIIEHGYRIKTVVTGHDSIPVDTPADADKVRGILHSTVSTS